MEHSKVPLKNAGSTAKVSTGCYDLPPGDPPLSQCQGALVHIAAMQPPSPGAPCGSGLLLRLRPGLSIKVHPPLEGPAPPGQARRALRGRQGCLDEEGARAAHGVSQNFPACVRKCMQHVRAVR